MLTLLVSALYSFSPQSPADFIDRIRLRLDADAYAPNLRIGDRHVAIAERAERAGDEELARRLLRDAADAFARAGDGAPDPRAEIRANDRAAAAYLRLGRAYLDEGRGRAFGVGRRPAALARAESVAACAAGLAPTSRRSEINRFVEELEGVLDRSIQASCVR